MEFYKKKQHSDVVGRDPATDREVEPHTPASSRISFHTTNQRAPKLNTTPTHVP